MQKKVFLTISLLIAITFAVVGMSAYEAHIVNVTAQIENSLSIDPSSLDFGNVFPQESFDDFVAITLSGSFVNQERVDTVNYMLRQKPKCWSELEQSYGLATEDEDGNFLCADGADYETLPVLCPFLSKEEISDDGGEENDSGRINAFHGSVEDWDMETTLATEVYGQLLNDSDIDDEWLIDLKTPCFDGECAQDWPEYVLAANPDVNPFDYVLAQSEKGKIFGCDLWFEVTGILKGDDSQGPLLTCVDSDGDGYGVGLERSLCPYSEEDCDDTAPDINPGITTEVCDDGVDNNCDGDTDCADFYCDLDPACTSPVSQTIAAGDLIITEVMQNPSAVSDSAGEWFELYNTSGETLNLEGCVISDLGTDSHAILGTLNISASGYLVLGLNDDFSTNGGVNLNYQYNSFTLANSDDEIILSCDSTEIDRVEYDGGSEWPDPIGKSMNFANLALDNNNPAYWCEASSSYGDGDLGTPGSTNDACTRSASFTDISPFEQYGYDGHDYASADVSFAYNYAGNDVIGGTVSGTGLKPYATYQLKFEGVPTCKDPVDGDDVANEAMGYRGRWWNDTDSANTNDSGYENDAIINGGTDCIIGYLVWDFVTADAGGNVSKAVLANNSYHVLWCDGVCDATGNSLLQNISGATVPPGFPFCDAGDVNGEIERFACGTMAFDNGDYVNKLILTEESFHQNLFGIWTGVMETDVEFSIY